MKLRRVLMGLAGMLAAMIAFIDLRAGSIALGCVSLVEGVIITYQREYPMWFQRQNEPELIEGVPALLFGVFLMAAGFMLVLWPGIVPIGGFRGYR